LKARIIAIDGPAASGKSTIGEMLARRLGYLYFDTGAMYRAVTWAALQQGIDPEDEAAVTRLAQALHIDILPPTAGDGRQYTVLADGKDITWEIRQPEVDANVSRVSAYRGVRAEMVRQQRRIAEGRGIVMVGRDIGTVVLPDADLKLYLDASAEERARRRYQELRERGRPADYDEILAMMRRRDAIDSGREISPLRAAKDAVVIDTTSLTIEQVIAKVLALVEREKCPQA
jgi:cytidylate kinase